MATTTSTSTPVSATPVLTFPHKLWIEPRAKKSVLGSIVAIRAIQAGRGVRVVDLGPSGVRAFRLAYAFWTCPPLGTKAQRAAADELAVLVDVLQLAAYEAQHVKLALLVHCDEATWDEERFPGWGEWI